MRMMIGREMMDWLASVKGADRTDYLSAALEFVDDAGHLSYEKFCRLAVRNSEALIDILRGTGEATEFLTFRQRDPEDIASRVGEMLKRLHFNPADDYYLALLLPRDADVSSIHQRWKSLMRVYHPDRQARPAGAGAGNAGECARRLNEVFDVLRDPKKKFSYDRRFDIAARHRTAGSFFYTGHLFIVLTALSIFVALFYFLLKSPDKASIPAGPGSQARPVDSRGAEETFGAASGVSASGQHRLSSARTGYAPRKKGIGSALAAGKIDTDAMLLAEEVNALMDRLMRAYDKGDLEAYLACYSHSAVETGRAGYEGIRNYYAGLFSRGSHHLSMRNLIVRKESEGIIVKGSFNADDSADRVEPGSSTARDGKFEMTLAREEGKLKIKYFSSSAAILSD